MLKLLSARRFAALFWTQFFSAFNDNFLKNSLVFLIMAKVAAGSAETLITVAGGVFILPFFLLSGLGGELADRFDKSIVAQRLKLAEFGAAGIAVIGFAAQSVPILFVALFLFGVISALFGPLKYGILPDHLATDELPAGNAMIEGATFIAILLGTIAGAFASHMGRVQYFAVAMLAVAAVSYAASRFIPRTGQAAPHLRVDANVLRSTGHLVKELWTDTRLWRAGVMLSLFWMFGSVVLSLLPPLAKTAMGGDETVVSVYLGVFAISVAIGSAIGSFLSSGRIVLLPAPVAMLGMGLFSVDLAFAAHGLVPPSATHSITAFFSDFVAWRVGFDLAGLAICGGIIAVPCFSAIQAWAPIDRRARVVGSVNVINAAFMVVGAAVFGALQAAGLSLSDAFALMAGLCALSAIWMFRNLPTSPLRDFLSILFRAVYRVEIVGRENIAKAGDNCIVALNHVSFLDAAFALSMLEKEPVFAIDSGIAKRWWVKPFLKITRAMPLDPTKPLATRALINAVKKGETLIIFPEGRLTVTGSLMKVYDGAGLIAEKSGAKIVPVRLDGFETTIFSRLNANQVTRRWFPKVKITILEPVELKVDDALRGKARRQAAGGALYQVMSDLMFRTTNANITIFDAIAGAARKHGMSRTAIEDPVSGELSYSKLLIGARVLAAKFTGLAPAAQPIGLMMPNINASAAAFLGLVSANRPPAMINFSSGAANILAACRAARVQIIVTSRAFVEKARLQDVIDQVATEINFVFLEDIKAGVSVIDKLLGAVNKTKAICKPAPDDRAVILFTSGSESTPKGVVHSHRAILSNVAQAGSRIDFGRTDKVFNVLPIFHSFGLTGGLILPLVSGVPVFLYPSPLHYRIVPELLYGANATVLFGTDTFLSGYARSAHPYDFRSLRYVIAGAEAVKETTRRLYAEKFGLRVLEGYGVTETAPILALNTPMFNRYGTVGRIMPGMETKLEPVPGIEDAGRLHVRGPNIMMGYLRAENPGVLERPVDGWHDTGDIVAIDAEGFVAIKGRAKRFAKIGGEMVSLAAVEAIGAECWPGSTVAVVSQPDPRKGERMVMITDAKGATRAQFIAAARTRGATELMIPAQVLEVDKVPLLGTGKTDYVSIARMTEPEVVPA